MPTLDLYDLTRPQLAELLKSWDVSPTHVGAIWRGLYRKFASDVAAIRDLPPRVMERLQRESAIGRLDVVCESSADDGQTTKYALALRDGRQIETVRMRIAGRTTACLSSQVGCALGCVFCATGQMGFTRNLTTGEIVAQAVHVARSTRLRSTAEQAGSGTQAPQLRNVVVMGMGEPLLNYDATMAALDILADPAGLALGHKQITVSTVGVVPGIVRLADERRPYSLAVSLHAANQTERADLLPAARTWPLDALMEACRYYATKLDRRIFFEWTVIAGRNDSLEHADELAALLAGLPAHVNLIPLNATTGYDGAVAVDETLDRFQARLSEQGLPTTVRRPRGANIAAACGQLAVMR